MYNGHSIVGLILLGILFVVTALLAMAVPWILYCGMGFIRC